MLLIDNTVEINDTLDGILINFINGKEITSDIYNASQCEIYNSPRLTGLLKRESRDEAIPNRSSKLKMVLPEGYTLQTIFGFLYEIIEIKKWLLYILYLINKERVFITLFIYF